MFDWPEAQVFVEKKKQSDESTAKTFANVIKIPFSLTYGRNEYATGVLEEGATWKQWGELPRTVSLHAEILIDLQRWMLDRPGGCVQMNRRDTCVGVLLLVHILIDCQRGVHKSDDFFRGRTGGGAALYCNMKNERSSKAPP